jgi:hypothetical protein
MLSLLELAFSNQDEEFVFILIFSCQCLYYLERRMIIEKEAHRNNFVQAEDNNTNEIIFNICLLLIQNKMWIDGLRW